jgi:hypothetical protein
VADAKCRYQTKIMAGRDEPSVMLLQARNRTTTAAVSRIVARKIPSIRWFEAYEKK